MTELEAAFERLANRGTPRDPDAVVDVALTTSLPRRRRVPAVMLSAAVLLVVASVVAVYVRSRVDDINRVDVASALSESPVTGEPTTLLIVGVDQGSRGVAGRGRADVIMLVRFDPAARTIAFLAVPHDIRARIPGTARDDRLNTAYVEGAERLIEAVADVTGIRPDHYVEVDFDGFGRLVDAVGGVELSFPAPVRDRLSGLEVAAGCQRLDGEQALAFVRARHLETREADGHYSMDPTGDLGRIQRQSALINSVLADFPREVAAHPTRLDRVADAVTDAVTLDSQLSLRTLVQQARELAQHPPTRSFLVVPTTVVTIDNAVFLEVDQSQMRDVVTAFNAPPKADRVDGPSC